ncbi:MAG: hypothetical protein ABSB79_09735 [Syntrophales bacterium]
MSSIYSLFEGFQVNIVYPVLYACHGLFLTSLPASAGLVSSVPSSPDNALKMRSGEMEEIQRVLENGILIGKLKVYRLTSSEINDKLRKMTNEQVHLLAQSSDRLTAGG